MKRFSATTLSCFAWHFAWGYIHEQPMNHDMIEWHTILETKFGGNLIVVYEDLDIGADLMSVRNGFSRSG